MRVGQGYDAHSFGGTPPVVLAGITVDSERGVIATSDGDVVAHAVTDAVLGAGALGDLGEWFPSDDPASEGADSMAILRLAWEEVRQAGFAVSSLDVTVVAETVRVAPHRSAMRKALAEALELPAAAVSVKATSTDGLGFVGRDEGIAALAVAVLEETS
ncbi:MAG: 2-C-methyl-D-erythritol 2,4-cyclodiphosphate synthase [Acidimicrobiia bacterium]